MTMDSNDNAVLKGLIESMNWNSPRPPDATIVDKSVPLSINEIRSTTDQDDVTSSQGSVDAITKTQESDNNQEDVTSQRCGDLNEKNKKTTNLSNTAYTKELTCKDDKSIDFVIHDNDLTNPEVSDPTNNHSMTDLTKLGIDLNWSFNQGTKFFQSTIDNITDRSCRAWYKPLWMDDVVVTTMSQSERFHESLKSERRYKQVNILAFLHKSWIDLPPLFYFKSDKYPITDGFLGKGWLSLKSAIYRYAIACGFKLISNGSARNKTYPKNKTIRCNHAITYMCRK